MKKWLVIILLVSVVSHLAASGLARPLASRSASPFEVGADGCMSRRSSGPLNSSFCSVSTVESEALEIPPRGVFSTIKDSMISDLPKVPEIATKPVIKAVSICATTYFYERFSHLEVALLGAYKKLKPLTQAICRLNSAKTVIEFRQRTVIFLKSKFGWQVEEVFIVSADEAEAGRHCAKSLSQFSSIDDIIACLKTKTGDLKGYIRITIAPQLEI
jgi:hypothetical protein